MELIQRKTFRNSSIRTRFRSITTNEMMYLKKLKRFVAVMLIKYKIEQLKSNNRCDLLKRVITAITLKYIHTKYELPYEISPSSSRRYLTIDSFSMSNCWNFFEFRKEDLQTLRLLLKLPTRCRLSNGSILPGEEVLLRGLYELVSGEDQYNIAENVFGGDQSLQSRVFAFFIDFIFARCKKLMTDNMEWWFKEGYLSESYLAIQKKLLEYDLDVQNRTSKIGLFIDCNCFEICRVAGGPRTEGEDAPRWNCNIQRAFYNGWKSIHGLKHQTLDTAHGFTIDMFGPTSVRRNDLFLLGESRVNDRLAELQINNSIQMQAYGDSIYPHLGHIKSSWRQSELDELQKQENHAYKSVRISIEWNYMNTANVFSYLKNLNKLRLMKTRNVSKVYVVATFLRNCRTFLYGSLSSSYFALEIDRKKLESYLENF